MQGCYKTVWFRRALTRFKFLENGREKVRAIGNQFRRLNVRLRRLQENKDRKKDGENDKHMFQKRNFVEQKRERFLS